MKRDIKKFLPWYTKYFDLILRNDFPATLIYGKTHIFFTRKKQLLKELYNIDWKTPQELNPWIHFD